VTTRLPGIRAISIATGATLLLGLALTEPRPRPTRRAPRVRSSSSRAWARRASAACGSAPSSTRCSATASGSTGPTGGSARATRLAVHRFSSAGRACGVDGSSGRRRARRWG
jgi:hypothetical protein